MKLALALSLSFLALCAADAHADILVYDDNAVHSYAQTAANNLQPGSVTVANSATFNALLGSQAWDVVALDMPSNTPGNFAPLIAYINGGGRVVMSFWDWDANAALTSAFGSTGTTGSFSLNGRTLSDTGATSLFSGVPMPHSAWHDHWSDDGDGFGLGAGTIGAATLSGVADPVIIVGNGGRTIAAPVFDEWDSNFGSGAVQLWENMLSPTVPEPTSLALFGLGILAVASRRRRKNTA